MPKISVVIPVYNAEKYITETLECIINQTMSDIEIICVNDASNDRSLNIIEQYAEQEYRIIIVNNLKNQGAAECRNIGLKMSSGLYICFLDADDLYSLDMIEREYKTICKYDADMAVVHSMNFTGNLKDYDLQENMKELKWNEQCVSIKNTEQTIIGAWNIAPWNKMYKKDFIETYDLHYQNLISSNDVFFGMMALFLAKRIALVESADPMVFHRTDAKMQISTRRTPLDAFWAFEKVHDAMVKEEIWNYYFEEFFEHFCNTIYNEFIRCKNEVANRQTYTYIAEEGLKRLGFFQVSENEYKDKRIHQWLCNFLCYSYDGAWFWGFEELLERNEYKIILKLRNYSTALKRIALWGAGTRAKVFMDFCEKRNYGVQFIVDKDLNKQGKYISGMKIHRFEDISDKVEIVIVLNSIFYTQIENEVNKINSKVEVFDLQKYLSN